MGYNKFIKSGNQLEIYEYEKESFAKGRPRGYKVNFDREMLDNSKYNAHEQREFARRKSNARHASMAFKRIVSSNLGSGEVPILITLTHKENIVSVTESARIFHIFTQRMRRTFGKEFRYIAVPEFQKRGAVHYHALFWGLPESLVSRERTDRTIATLWGSGFVDVLKTDGHNKLSSYLADYMVESISDIRLLYHKAYFASRNIKRPLVGKDIPTWWLEDEFELSTYAVLLLFKEFDTMWLGKGRYKYYQLRP